MPRPILAGRPKEAHTQILQRRSRRGTNRAIRGREDHVRPSHPRAASEIVADLNALLSAASVPGPYVLVGHSAGGMFVQMYARTFPENVAGVIAMNPVPPFAEWREQGFLEMTKQERAGEIAYYEGGER